MDSLRCGWFGGGVRLFTRLAGKTAAFSIFLLMVLAGCSAEPSELALAAGGTSNAPLREPGSSVGEVSASERELIDASVRAYVADQQSRPRGDLKIQDASVAKAPGDLWVGEPQPVGALNNALDLPGPQPTTPTQYPLSADGKYYKVNLLYRNFLPPTASATFSSGVQQLGAAAPPFVFDGGDKPFTAVTAVPGDPNVVVTLTVDMGQYYSVGAVRPLYQPFGGGYPFRQRIRLATKLGPNAVWRVPVEDSPVPNADTTLSFDATPGRYLELTMIGNGCNLLELFVYPSSQTALSPTSVNGYDLTSLGSTSTVNSNFSPLGSAWPVSWPAGGFYPKSLTSGATGDAVATIDLGAPYPVSRLALGFFWSTTWVNGGRLEVASTPDTYATVADSGSGQTFFPWPHLGNFAVPPQPVRYIRATDYFIPGSGPSAQTLWSVQAFAGPGRHVGYYPLSADGKYFAVNLIRRPTGDAQPTASVVYANGAVPAGWGPQVAGNAIDGDDTVFFWSGAGAVPNATATLTVDLGQEQSLGAIQQRYFIKPTSSSLRVRGTLGPWTQLRADTPVTDAYTTSSFDAVSARYIELTMKGTPATGHVALQDLLVYPSTATDPAPSSGSRLDLTYLTGMAYFRNANMASGGGAQIHAVPGAYSAYVKTPAQGGTGDGTLTVDLGQQYQVSEVDLSFHSNQRWTAGGKLDVDDGSGNWNTVFDSGRGMPLGLTGDGPQKVVFVAPRTARYVRLTGYFDPAVANGLLTGIEVFGESVPCTSNCEVPGQCSGSNCASCLNGQKDGDEWAIDCGPSCENKNCRAPITPCTTNADCGPGTVCSSDAPKALALSPAPANACWNEICVSGLVQCGSPDATCGSCLCHPTCANKQCGDDLFDGCNEFCDPVCTTHATGCKSDAECALGNICLTNAGSNFGISPDADICVPERCLNPGTAASDCGSPEAPCGTVCNPPAYVPCQGMACGKDPKTETDCGSCVGGSVCSIDNSCVEPGDPIHVLAHTISFEVGATPGTHAVNAIGRSTYRIPLRLPPAARDLTPNLELVFSDSSHKRGLLGPGWSLGGASQIHRCAVPSIQSGKGSIDIYAQEPLSNELCLDGVQLRISDSLSTAETTVFKMANDDHSKIVQSKYLGESSFKVFKPDGTIYSYGNSREERRRVYPFDPDPLFTDTGEYRPTDSWHLAEVRDRFGNVAKFHYSAERIAQPFSVDSSLYLTHIDYSGRSNGNASSSYQRRITFKYHSKDDALGFTGGYFHLTPVDDNRLLESITVDTFDGVGSHAGDRIYKIGYAATPGNGIQRVDSIQECAGYESVDKCLPATTFRYDDAPAADGSTRRFGTPKSAAINVDHGMLNYIAAGGTKLNQALILDVDGDGFKDILHVNQDLQYLRFWHAENQSDGSVRFGTPVDIVGPKLNCVSAASIADLDGDGRDEIIDSCPIARNKQQVNYFNIDASGVVTESPVGPTKSIASAYIGDIDGNGRPDIIQETDSHIYFSDFTGYAGDGSLQFRYNSRVEVKGKASPTGPGGAARQPLMIDVDGDGTRNLMRFDPTSKQFYALRLASDHELTSAERAKIDFDSATEPGGPVIFINRIARWIPTGLSYQVSPLTGAPGHFDSIRVMDINGDGLDDVWVQSATLLAPLDPNLGRIPEDTTTGTEPSYVSEITNINRLVGQIFGSIVEAGPSQVWINVGGAFKLKTVIIERFDGLPPDPCTVRTSDGFCVSRLQHEYFRNSTVMDYDNDGRDELIVPLGQWHRISLLSETPQRVYLSADKIPDLPNDLDLYSKDVGHPFKLFYDLPLFADFNGDANLDMLVAGYDNTPANRLLVMGTNQGSGSRLINVTDGLGNRVDVEHSKDRSNVDISPGCGDPFDALYLTYRPRCLTAVPTLVSRVSRGANSGDDYGQTTYAYEHPASADFLRGFYFTARTMDDKRSMVGEERATVSGMREEFGQVLDNGYFTRKFSYPFLFTPSRRELHLSAELDLVGEWRSRSVVEDYQYKHFGTENISYLAENTRTIWDDSSAGPVQTLRRHDVFFVDGKGLPWIHDQTTYAGPDQVEIASSRVLTERDANLNQWLLGNVLRLEETSARNGVSKTKIVTFEYDEQTGFRNKKIEHEGDADRELVTEYTPDAFGNVAQVTETSSTGHRITTFDFGARGIFPKTVTNAENHVGHFEYDDVWGRPTLTEDENHYRTIQCYDGFGRLIRGEVHNGGEVTLLEENTYDRVEPYKVGNVHIRAVFRKSTSSDLFSGAMSEEYDARGLPVRTKTPGISINGSTPYLFTESGYDWDGRRIFLSGAHIATEQPVWSWFEYDLRGRAVTSGSPLGEKHFKYSSFAQLGAGFPEWTFPDSIELTHITDEEGKQAVAIGDHDGALIASASGVDLAAGNAGFVSRTVRGAMGLPTKLIDPELHETSTEYDADGLVSWSEDASRGRTQFFYDAYGNLKRIIAADNVESEFVYDRINRVTSRIDDDQGPTEWSYDQDALGQPKLGRLTEMVGPTGIRTVFGYEGTPRALGTSVTRQVGSETFTTTLEFDALGHPIRIEYPKVHQPGGDFEFAVRPVFDPHSGQLVAMKSDDETTDFWRITDSDTRGRVTEVTLGNGVREGYGFEPVSQLLSSVRVVDQSGSELSSLAYSYYQNGQISGRYLSSGGVARSRTLTYDDARRLDNVTETGPGALDESFGFSPSGRLVSRTKLGVYTPDAQRPLAVGSVAGNQFSYDDRGNQRTRTGPNIPGDTQTLSYNRFNLPSQVLFGDPANPDRTVNYEYDAAGNRVVKRETNGGVEVLSLGAEFERTKAGGSTAAIQDKFRIFAPGGEVAQLIYNEETASSELLYLHRDGQRSVLFTTNGTGQASELRDFDLFGKPVATPAWTNTTSEAFTGHRNDADTALVDAGARLYDAAFGVFISADPLRISGPGSQGFNPYAYANNDPVNLVDPTGLQAADWWNNPGTWSNPSGTAACRPPGCGSGDELTYKPFDAPITEFLGNGAAQGGSLSQQELERVPSGYAAGPVHTSLTRPEFKVRDTSEFWRKAMHIVVASYSLLPAAEGLAGYLGTRAFLANAAKLGINGERGVCAFGLCPCFVAGTLVDTDNGGKPIEQVELGDRVGPELDLCAVTDFAQWREVDLVMTVNDHGVPDELELHLLRPEAWIREQGIQEGRLINVTLDDLNVSGPAHVTRLGASGQVAAGNRCPVTGWVRHTSHDVIALALDREQTLEVTRHHRLFSVDRGAWVHAGDVQDGEALQTQEGVVHAKHAGIEALAAVEVFNLEVFGAHQYFVGAHRVLAHNVYGTASTAGVQIGGQTWRVFQPGEVACQSGCQGVAEAIQAAIGGEVRQIVPTAGRFLGEVRNAAGQFVNPAGAKALGWSDHYVVVQGGRVFDALTGPKGLVISEYKALWQYAEAIKFGF